MQADSPNLGSMTYDPRAATIKQEGFFTIDGQFSAYKLSEMDRSRACGRYDRSVLQMRIAL
jgi:hypothetical protein